MIIGHHKEKDPKLIHERNYGSPLPEDFRKALRLMKLGEKYNLPILTFIDTPGAWPSVESESRGIAQAIAYNLMEMSIIKSPILTTVIGEGGSGGALGIAVGDKVLMQRNAYYSVISPEGCSSILWKNNKQKEAAAESLMLKAEDLKKFKLIDEIVEEPAGGAHLNLDEASEFLRDSLDKNLCALLKYGHNLLEERNLKWRRIGSYFNE